MEDNIIDAVRQKTVLYDPKDRNYLNVRVKNQQWDEIAREVGMPNGTTVKSVWEKLRHSFRDALRRQKNMIRSGVAPESLKAWKHQNQMAFLLPYMNTRVHMNRRRDGCASQNDSDNDNDNSQMATYSFDDGPTEIEIQDLMCDSEYVDHSTMSTNSMDDSPPTQITSVKRKKNIKTKSKKHDITLMFKQNLEEEVKQELEEDHVPIIGKLEERKLMLENTNVPNDPLYHFFISMYETTIKMPPAAQHTVRNRIFNAVTSMEATLLDFTGIPLT